MTQHGEEPAVVRTPRTRLSRTLRSAAPFALSTGLALTVAAATALPGGPVHAPRTPHLALAEAIGGHTHIPVAPPLSERPSRPRPPGYAGQLAGTSTSKVAPAASAKAASAGVVAGGMGRVAVAIAALTPTPAQQLLRFRTKASRMRGQPDLG